MLSIVNPGSVDPVVWVWPEWIWYCIVPTFVVAFILIRMAYAAAAQHEAEKDRADKVYDLVSHIFFAIMITVGLSYAIAGLAVLDSHDNAQIAWGADVVEWLDAEYGIEVEPSQLDGLTGRGAAVYTAGDELVFARIIAAPDGDLAVLADGRVVDPLSR